MNKERIVNNLKILGINSKSQLEKNEIDFWWEKKYIEILGKKMAYIDHGEGDSIVFLHGNPASSFLWRNITPYLEGMGRIIVPDLIGMGDSEKLDGIDNPDYKYHGQYKYLSTLLDQ